jgi:hypothetical protein
MVGLQTGIVWVRQLVEVFFIINLKGFRHGCNHNLWQRLKISALGPVLAKSLIHACILDKLR